MVYIENPLRGYLTDRYQHTIRGDAFNDWESRIAILSQYKDIFSYMENRSMLFCR